MLLSETDNAQSGSVQTASDSKKKLASASPFESLPLCLRKIHSTGEMGLKGRPIKSRICCVKVANCCNDFQCQKEMIIGAPFSPHKARVPVSLNITSPLPYCERQKRALRHPQWFSGGSRRLSFESGSTQCFLNLPQRKG